MTHEQRSRPAGNRAADTPNDHPNVSAPDLMALSPDKFDAFNAGYQWGYVAGIERGRQLADEEAAALSREAVRIVHAMASIPPRDAQADAERADRRAAWWDERRGEVAS